ncbi:MAG: hypothetical protein LQ350_004830 [Teloschistes chrysophthalmus]|nr:MAG: hypothetical protein LQ350_004830 [Niorma chrysophthalma]
MATQYQYTSLKPREIRLVQFKQQDVTGNILCQFRTVNIDELPVSYTAISYCWGSSDRVAEVSFVNGQTLRITRSVEEIVHWLADKEGYFWVDFLCINQDDLDEKGTQVAFMSIVFSRSARVAAWLGKEIEDGEAAFDYLTRTESAYGVPGAFIDTSIIRNWQEDFSEVNNLRGLLRHPWFRRAWVVQEVVNARNIPTFPRLSDHRSLLLHIGKFAVPWSALALVVEMMWTRDPQNDDLEADDLRKAFAKKSGDGALLPDYKAPVSYVYNRTAFDLLTKHHNLQILLAAGVGHVRTDEDLASWAPDWRIGKSLMGGYMIFNHLSPSLVSHTPYVQGH